VAREGEPAFSDSGFTVVDDVKINGKLTLGENVADNGNDNTYVANSKSLR
jgi:hypothetical protein